MKLGNVSKSLGSTEITADMLAKINKFTRKNLTAEEVYVIPITMCDNELDRDYDKFTVNALNGLAEKFIGKPVIFDHHHTALGQTARIFETGVVHVPETKTYDNEDLYQLTCNAYMLKSESTKHVIENLDAGILKEVSVGCSVEKQICSVCGKEYFGGECVHYRRKLYENKPCFVYLDGAKDAYELSFVTVPAQPGAGVRNKWYEGDEDTKKKGVKTTMNYEETKKSLSEIGVDLDGIATEKGVVPELGVILGAVKKKFDELPKAELDSTEEFISAEKAKSVIGKDMAADEILAAAKSFEEADNKAKAYDEIKNKAIDDAIASGIKAKGDAFNEERIRKFLESCTVAEIKDWANDYENEAKKALAAGRISEDSSQKAMNTLAYDNLDDFRI